MLVLSFGLVSLLARRNSGVSSLPVGHSLASAGLRGAARLLLWRSSS